MRTFKTKWFQKWAAREGLTDTVLVSAVEEIEAGLIDADMGGHMVKKRVALPGRGKRGSTRHWWPTNKAIKAGELIEVNAND